MERYEITWPDGVTEGFRNFDAVANRIKEKTGEAISPLHMYGQRYHVRERIPDGVRLSISPAVAHAAPDWHPNER